MNRIGKKVLSLLIALSMLMGLVTTGAMAQNLTGDTLPESGYYQLETDPATESETLEVPLEGEQEGDVQETPPADVQEGDAEEVPPADVQEGDAEEVPPEDVQEGDAEEIPQESVIPAPETTEEVTAEPLEALIPLADEFLTLSGGEEIAEDGTYQLAENATGMITLGESVTEITLIGQGAEFDDDYQMISTSNDNLGIDCTAASGVSITLQDVYLNNSAYQSILNFAGEDNELVLEGVNVIEHQIGGGSNAAIHVDVDTELTISGSGTLYFYKSAQGAGFGGNTGELNGTIAFDGPTVFAKGTKQGALIGAGSNAKGVGIPGEIAFLAGEFNLITNSRGAAVGGSAGAGGASAGTVVTFGEQASVNINVDYSGSAVGGGGYAEGNDSAGGYAYFEGGSVRVYVDKNAVGNTDWGGTLEQGLNDLPITAAKRNNIAQAAPVYKLAFDTSLLETSADSFTVKVDGKTYYSGGLHSYSFIQENLDKDKGEQISITSTPMNWLPNDDTCLYLYLTGEDHELNVNGERFAVTFDESFVGTEAEHTEGPFQLDGVERGNPDANIWDGTLDFSWYDETELATEYHITKPAQWAALAWICSEHLSDLADYPSTTKGNVIDIYGTIPTAQYTFPGVQFYLDNDLDMGGVYNAEAATWSGPNYYPVGSQTLNDLGTTNFYGLFYGSFDGQGHTVANIYCDRGIGQAWQSAGLFGRVGAADNNATPNNNIVIENVAVTGYIRSGRSVGGIVGKTLSVSAGYQITVRNCLNFAQITSSDAKGTGGITGAGWNDPIIDNCANFGSVTANYKNGGGISGSFEGTSNNCYNVGDITKSKANNGQSFGTNNGGAEVFNFYWLTGTSNTVGNNAAIYSPSANSTTYEITDNYNESDLTALDYMKSEAFLKSLDNETGAWAFALTSDSIYQYMDELGWAGYPVPTVFATAVYSVTVETTPENATVVLKQDGNTVTPEADGSYLLQDGTIYSYTVSADGYITQTGQLTAEKDGAITVTLAASGGGGGGGQTGSGNIDARVWDGKSIDVSWYDPDDSEYYISTPAQLAGLAAIVNGIYNKEIDTFHGDTSYIVDNVGGVTSSGPNGMNESTGTYHYGDDDFNGKTVYLDDNINMSGGNYMPIGGQYLMIDENTSTKLGSSFCGVLDGQGHRVTIQCDRHCSAQYGDGSSVGFIGRIGVHDNDPSDLRPSGAGVYNVAVYGSVRGNRSVGGIVGKIGKTADGVTIESCANFASITGTDAKGTGGIVGAAWNSGEIINCYNAGAVRNSYKNAGGIAGSCEIAVTNCFNVGKVTSSANNDMGIATNNGGAVFTNCYYLDSTTTAGGVYPASNEKPGAVEAKTSAEMKSIEFLNLMGSAFAQDNRNANQGYPILAWQDTGATTGTGTGGTATETEETVETEVKTQTKVSDGTATITVDADSLSKDADKADKNTQFVVSGDLTDEDVDTVIISVAKDALKDVADAGASVKTETPVADLVFSNAALEELTTLSGKTVTIKTETVTDGVKVTLAVDGKTVSELNAPIKAVIHDVEAGQVAVFVAEDGTETILPKSVVDNGTLYVLLNGSGTVKVMDNQKSFSDVTAEAWYASAVDFATSHGLFQGVNDTTFAPETTMSRAMLVATLYRLEGTPEGQQANFADVSADAWYASAVAWASENDIVSGTGNGFLPDSAVTREQLVSILYRYAEKQGMSIKKQGDLTTYVDADGVSAWAEDAMAWAVGSGIVSGKNGARLDPAGTATRAEVAAVLQRFVALLVK